MICAHCDRPIAFVQTCWFHTTFRSDGSEAIHKSCNRKGWGNLATPQNGNKSQLEVQADHIAKLSSIVNKYRNGEHIGCRVLESGVDIRCVLCKEFDALVFPMQEVSKKLVVRRIKL